MSLGHLVAAAEIERVEISEDPVNRTWDRITRTTVCLQRRRNTLHISPYTRKKSEGVMSADRRIACNRWPCNLLAKRAVNVELTDGARQCADA
jgi:hypothetical protein